MNKMAQVMEWIYFVIGVLFFGETAVALIRQDTSGETWLKAGFGVLAFGMFFLEEILEKTESKYSNERNFSNTYLYLVVCLFLRYGDCIYIE